MLGIVIWGIAAFTAAVAAWPLAVRKNRNASFWAAWSFLIPPLVFVLALLPRADVQPRKPSPIDALRRQKPGHEDDDE
jgi:hypothetical protein